jgi:hypothetical protein
MTASSSIQITGADLALLRRLIVVLHDWSGVSDETPDDTEILAGAQDIITLGDLRDASSILNQPT